MCTRKQGTSWNAPQGVENGYPHVQNSYLIQWPYSVILIVEVRSVNGKEVYKKPVLLLVSRMILRYYGWIPFAVRNLWKTISRSYIFNFRCIKTNQIFSSYFYLMEIIAYVTWLKIQVISIINYETPSIKSLFVQKI